MKHGLNVKSVVAMAFISAVLAAASRHVAIQALDAHSKAKPDASRAEIIKRWSASGTCELFWADGLAVLGGVGYKITRLDANGRVLADVNTKWMVQPSSIHCNDAVVMGQFLTRSRDIRDRDAIRGFPGMIDLRNGEHTKLASGDKLSLFLNVSAYSCQFWSPDRRMLLGREPGDSMQKRLALVQLPSQEVTLWAPANGGHPSSWVWSEDDRRKGFWVLTDHPGALYHLNGDSQEGQKIPALDDARTVVLSPNLDRAVAFDMSCRGAYLVDLSKPSLAQPISVEGRADARSLSRGWGTWSPDGKQVALLLVDSADGAPYELYLGDPVRPLRRAHISGFRFPGRDWIDTGEPTGLPGSGSIVWDANNKYIYCRMIDEKRSRSGDVKYAIARVSSDL